MPTSPQVVSLREALQRVLMLPCILLHVCSDYELSVVLPMGACSELQMDTFTSHHRPLKMAALWHMDVSAIMNKIMELMTLG